MNNINYHGILEDWNLHSQNVVCGEWRMKMSKLVMPQMVYLQDSLSFFFILSLFP